MQAITAQLAGRQRDQRLMELTRGEISRLDSNTPVYYGLGKMFCRQSLDENVEDLAKRIGETTKEIDGLKKRQQYLQTTFDNCQSSMKEIMGRQA